MNYSCQEEADFYEGHPEDDEPPLEMQLFEMVYQWGKVGADVNFTAPAYQKLLKEIVEESKQ